MIKKTTEITATIDWISVSAASIVHPDWMSREFVDMKRGMLNYDCGIKYLDGRVELWHSKRDDMGSHLILSGEALTNMQALHGKSVWDILKAYGYARPSRIDVAVDVRNGTLNMKKMAKQITASEVDTKATGGMYLENIGEDDGETLYLGSVAGNRRLRVYDKAAESGIDGQWTRIELQTRQRQAQKAAMSLMTRLGDVSAIPEMILSFADWQKYPDWVKVMGTTKLKLTRLEKPPSARRRWILDTCAKALAKEIEYGSGQGIVGELLDRVGVEQDILNEKIKAHKS